jgi:hypothetical protein
MFEFGCVMQRALCQQDLVLDAPNQFQCAISAQLMMDPVQTPEALQAFCT